MERIKPLKGWRCRFCSPELSAGKNIYISAHILYMLKHILLHINIYIENKQTNKPLVLPV